MKNFHNIKKIFGISTITAIMMSSIPSLASAQTTLGSMTTGYTTQVNSLAHLLIAIAFFVGLGLVFFGLMKLKKASDSQGRDSYMPGIISIAIGGLAVGLPALTGVGYATMFNGNGGSAPTQGSVSIN